MNNLELIIDEREKAITRALDAEAELIKLHSHSTSKQPDGLSSFSEEALLELKDLVDPLEDMRESDRLLRLIATALESKGRAGDDSLCRKCAPRVPTTAAALANPVAEQVSAPIEPTETQIHAAMDHMRGANHDIVRREAISILRTALSK